MIANRLPRSWSLRIDQLRRDVSTVTRRLGGANAPPVVARTVRPAETEPAKARVDAKARPLVVTRVIRETADAVTLVLCDPEHTVFDFQPGQFFTLLVELEGEVVPRNYSASNAPGSSELHLTIKRKVGGRVSGVLVRARAGDTLRVLGPFGSFVLSPRIDAAHCRKLVLVAGGAGITPLASIARSVLAVEPASEIALVYGNRREADVALASELEALAIEHGPRFRLVHVLEEGVADPGLHVGRLDRATTKHVLDTLPLAAVHAVDTRFFVCGPDPMRDEVVAALTERGIATDRIHVERFTIGPRPQVEASSAALAASAAPGARPVAIRIGKDLRHATVLPGATLLEAGLSAGLDMPFSCAAGGCGACRVRVVEGDVELEEPNCLSDSERAAGYVLTCVGRPCGPCTIEVGS